MSRSRRVAPGARDTTREDRSARRGTGRVTESGMKLMLPALLLIGCDAQSADPPLPDAGPVEVILNTHALDPGQRIEGVFTGDGSAKIHLTAVVAEIDWSIDDGNGGAKVHEYLDQRDVDFPIVLRAGASSHLQVTNGGTAPITVSSRIELYALPGNGPAFAWK